MANDIAVTLTSDTRQFSRGMKSARDDLSLLGSSINTIKGAVAGFLTFQALKGGVGALTDTIGKLDDLAAESERLGVSTEFLSELQHAAKLSDTDIGALNGGLEKLEKNLGKATLEGGDLTKMLDRVGLDADQLRKSGPEEAFLQIADAASQISDPIQRAAFVTDVFGKSGQSLIGILAKGRAGINELRADARRLGVSLSSDVAEKIGLADDSLKRLDSSLMGLKTTLASSFAPTITRTADFISDTLNPAIEKMAAHWERAGDNLGVLIHLMSDARNFLPKFLGGTQEESVRQFIKDREAERLAIAAGKKGGENKAGAGGADIDLGGIQKDFKSFAKPLAIDSKEGFSTLARALTKPSGNTIADKQLAEAKIANKHLGNIEDGLKNQPKIAPKF